MRTTRKRKGTPLRFDQLESRELRTGGITPNDTLFSQQWGLSNSATGVDIEAPAAWAITTGSSSVIVADVGSTGVNLNNPDLAGKIWTNPTPNSDPNYPGALHGWNFTNNNADLSDVNSSGSPDGHGTNVAGIIGAASNNGQGIAGVAWASPVMPLKSSTVAQDALAVQFAVAHGAKVINMSFGYTYTSAVSTAFLQQSDPLYQAIEAADLQGVVVVVAAGNSGTAGNTSGVGQDLATTPVYPAAFRLPNMITVAAVDSSGNLASFSNYGATTVDLAAPGVGITTTGLDSQGEYINYAGGTSFAAPFVSGVAALVEAQHPEYTAEQVVQRIDSTARPLPSLTGKTITGGMVDAYLALKAGLPTPTTATGVSIAVGASTSSGTFLSDSAYATGGSTYTIPDPNQTVDTSGVTNPDPQSVYRTERYDGNSFTESIPNLTPNTAYTVRLDFSENYFNSAGQRTFNVAIDGTTVLGNFDIFATAGGKFKAIARSFNATADASGKISIVFTNVMGGAKVDGIEITPGTTTIAPVIVDEAQGKPAYSSTVESSGYLPGNAVDGNSTTRWSSGQWMQSGSTGWIYVDLGSALPIGEVRLNWETAYAVNYQIQVSSDASSWTTIATINGNATAGVHTTDGLASTARYVRIYCTQTSAINNNYSLYDLSIFPTSETDLAVGDPAYSSTVESSSYLPANAFDGNSTTRWSSGQWMQSGETGWVYVDLGSVQSFNEVRLNWETAYGVDYQIQVSNDASNWTTIANVVGNGTAGVHDYSNLNATGRYVRMIATRPSTINNNYSLYDFDVYS